MLNHIEMLPQLHITKHMWCGTTFLKWFFVTCVEPRIDCHKGKLNPCLSEDMINH